MRLSHLFGAIQSSPLCMPNADREFLFLFLFLFFNFATISDLWSSRTSKPYLSLAIHFIDDWKLKSTCFQSNYRPEDHTGELIAHDLKEALLLESK